MVIYRVDYEQITVPKHTWKVKPNATPKIQIKKNTKIK